MVDAEILAPAKSLDAPVLTAIAARVGKTRLIDNVRCLARENSPSARLPRHDYNYCSFRSRRRCRTTIAAGALSPAEELTDGVLEDE